MPYTAAKNLPPVQQWGSCFNIYGDFRIRRGKIVLQLLNVFLLTSPRISSIYCLPFYKTNFPNNAVDYFR